MYILKIYRTEILPFIRLYIYDTFPVFIRELKLRGVMTHIHSARLVEDLGSSPGLKNITFFYLVC
jgi:hypothetical protein